MIDPSGSDRSRSTSARLSHRPHPQQRLVGQRHRIRDLGQRDVRNRTRRGQRTHRPDAISAAGTAPRVRRLRTPTFSNADLRWPLNGVLERYPVSRRSLASAHRTARTPRPRPSRRRSAIRRRRGPCTTRLVRRTSLAERLLRNASDPRNPTHICATATPLTRKTHILGVVPTSALRRLESDGKPHRARDPMLTSA
jgi:hypothetical protein